MTRALLQRGRLLAPHRPLLSLFSLALAALPACSGPDDDPPAPVAYDVERYDLAAEYDWDRDRLVATLGLVVTLPEGGSGTLTLDSAVTSVAAVHTSAGDELPFTEDTAARLLAVDLSVLGDQPAGARLELALDYEASPGDGLSAVRPRAGDPVTLRTLFTDSEPLDASTWMPCNNRPDDRALFSVDMTMAPAEKMIANGDLVADEGGGASPRRMKYQTAYPLPPYLMAFAVGEFDVEEATAGTLPLSIWHRPGVAASYPETLTELARQLATFESLLGPYPFEKYALVMVPDFGGGMENASITFQSEVQGAEPALSMSLLAHELGHQWWGDAVTVSTWDDLWIKEGMAVLLENEAARPFDDETSTGALFAERYYVEAYAARDVSLAPLEKYTSGPYDRAAWIFTQIRHQVGEQAFWSTLRDLLAAHRFGTIGTDDLLAAFEPHLGAPATERARRAVDTKPLPTLDVRLAGPGLVEITLRDPDDILLAPLEIEWHHPDGTTKRSKVTPGVSTTLAPEGEGAFLVVDPDDVHPALWHFIVDQESWDIYWDNLAPLQIPPSASGNNQYSEISGIHQTTSLIEGVLPPVSPDTFLPFSASLDSETARAAALARACARAATETDPAVQEAWTAVLTGALTAEPHYRGLPFAPRLAACSDVIDPLALFAPEWDELAAGLPTPTVPIERVHYLSSFDLPFADGLDIWSEVAAASHSLRARTIAARYVRTRGYATAADEDLPTWRAAVLTLAASTRAAEVLRQILPAAAYFTSAPSADRTAFLDILLDILLSPATRPAHATAVCAAYTLTTSDPTTWQSFTEALEAAPLAPQARLVLEDPAAACE